MSTTTHAMPSLFQASSAIAAEPLLGADRAQAVSSLWSLITSLQTTLDLAALVKLIHQQVGHLVPHEGCSFRAKEHGFEENAGRTGGHSCNLALVLDGERLGELRFYRRERFERAEIAALEGLCSLLHFPLRNAVSFKNALRGCRLDSLTGLGNRTALSEALRRELDLFQRTGRPFALLVLDLDHFKQVNDRYGHLVGDRVLVTVSESISRNLRSSDLLFRYGGEEFVALLPGGQDFNPCRIAERVRQRVESLSRTSLADVPGVTLSSGCAVVQPGDSGEGLLERADRALYKAKRAGRNRVESLA